jgi:hypothetical protein
MSAAIEDNGHKSGSDYSNNLDRVVVKVNVSS